MLLHPYSREQKLQQINSLRQKAASKEIVNEQRRKQQCKPPIQRKVG